MRHRLVSHRVLVIAAVGLLGLGQEYLSNGSSTNLLEDVIVVCHILFSRNDAILRQVMQLLWLLFGGETTHDGEVVRASVFTAARLVYRSSGVCSFGMVWYQ